MIKVVRHDTLRDCFEAFIGRSMDDEDIKLGYWAGHDGTKPFKIKLSKFMQTTRLCWGWSSYHDRIIHLWKTDDCPEIELLSLLAHEIGHFQRPRYQMKDDEEKKASIYERVAKTAYEMMRDME
jgi:hypothetical protein